MVDSCGRNVSTLEAISAIARAFGVCTFAITFLELTVLVPSGIVGDGSVLARLCLVWDVDAVCVLIISLSRSLELSNDCGMEQ